MKTACTVNRLISQPVDTPSFSWTDVRLLMFLSCAISIVPAETGWQGLNEPFACCFWNDNVEFKKQALTTSVFKSSVSFPVPRNSLQGLHLTLDMKIFGIDGLIYCQFRQPCRLLLEYFFLKSQHNFLVVRNRQTPRKIRGLIWLE